MGGHTQAGGLAGTAEWAAIMPIDTIKTRYTMAAGTPLRAVVREIMKEGGLVGFYRGFVPTMLRAFPANGARPTPLAMPGSQQHTACA